MKSSGWLALAVLAGWWWLSRRAAPLTQAPTTTPAASGGGSGGASPVLTVAPDAVVYVASPEGGYLATGDEVARRAQSAGELGDPTAWNPPEGHRPPDPQRVWSELVRAEDAGAVPDPWRDALVLDYAAGRLAQL